MGAKIVQHYPLFRLPRNDCNFLLKKNDALFLSTQCVPSFGLGLSMEDFVRSIGSFSLLSDHLKLLWSEDNALLEQTASKF